MDFDLDKRTVNLSVGEFAAFTTGPRDAGSGVQGVWRAQLGTHWHNELRARATADIPATEFEFSLAGRIFHHGWTLHLNGRIDQLLRTQTTVTPATGGAPTRPSVLLREIKTITRAVPADETELRADYPEYFAQLAAYAVLWRTQPAEAATQVRAELCFVEVGSGLSQALFLTPADDTYFRVQLERVTEFLNLRLRARERLRHLSFRPAFAHPRAGQETTQLDLTATFAHHPLVFFEAPTGFGKTGVLLEFALGQLRSGHFERALYLTSKSTGQLQVVSTLQGMMAPADHAANGAVAPPSMPVAVWHVRNKSEHCINTTFHCVRENCQYLDQVESRWAESGLARFYLDEKHARDLATLRAAGSAARICPYEITRAALAFNDVWIGDYNYVFAPANRGLFYSQPGFDPARTLLLLDEAHNLPSRVADAHSHSFTAADAFSVSIALHRLRPLARLMTAWDHWCHCLQHLRACEALSATEEDDVRHVLGELARIMPETAVDYAALGPQLAALLWQIPSLHEQLSTSPLPTLWWCPRDGELALTCLDAASVIAATLREFGGVVLASATLTPLSGFAVACGLDAPAEVRVGNLVAEAAAPDRLGSLNKRQTKKLYRQLTRGSDLLRVEEARDAAAPALLRAHTPWRDGAYDIAVDARVDTTYQHRAGYYATTAATITLLHQSPSAVAGLTSDPSSLPADRSIAVFFPSYAYAEAIARELAAASTLRVALQPRLRDLAAQTAWVEQSLLFSDALFLVLGSSFAEGIDALGGRVSHAMVVGPALPEVNAVQRARLAEFASLGRDAAFRRVYQIPGMTKVNQALGRLVRAPGHHARVLLHCRRFLEPSYAALLAPDYQLGSQLRSTEDLEAWLGKPSSPAPPRSAVK
jgi:DNA excision repair protein ERCC-2